MKQTDVQLSRDLMQYGRGGMKWLDLLYKKRFFAKIKNRGIFDPVVSSARSVIHRVLFAQGKRIFAIMARVPAGFSPFLFVTFQQSKPRYMNLTAEQEQALKSLTPQQLHSFQSSMTPEQAQGLIGSFSISILNSISEKLLRDVQSIKLVFSYSKNKVECYINDQLESAAKIMMVQEFMDGIAPAIDGIKPLHDVNEVDGYKLEISIGKWSFEVYGKKASTGALTYFDISPIQIIPYIKK